MFPYPSGAGLHVGHPEGLHRDRHPRRATSACAASTCCTRWAGTPSACRPSSTRSRPASTRARPRAATSTNFRRQLESLGSRYDWSREIDTTDPGYVRWTQWIFRKLYERGPRLRGRGAGQLVPGAGHRARQRGGDRRQERARRPPRRCACRCGSGCCGSPPTPTGCSTISTSSTGPRAIKEMQRDWIGRSRGRAGALRASRAHAGRAIEVFTTRPDTLFGATYMVLAPEHPLVARHHDAGAARRGGRLLGERRARAASARAWPRPTRRPASSPAPTRVNPVNGAAHPDLDRRLRARRLRHRRDHGRARPRRARLRVRARASGCRSSRS